MTNARFREIVQTWLDSINSVKNEKFAIDETGRCKFFFNDMEFILEVPDGSDRFFIYAPLFEVPIHSDGLLYYALSLNLFQVETVGTTLAIDRSANFFVLSYHALISTIDSAKFQKLLGAFIYTTQTITEKLLKEHRRRSARSA
ncbi:MAG: CesT family type III secretion system chaperone [Puniceicoccales bacterium]|jgi:hypothetical protein|nr:CesT family type III secretion system chaperone [Puniceicoccales bacterium]